MAIPSTNTSTTSAYQISPPESFTFSTPTNWPKWKQRFLRFRTASGLSLKTEVEQVDALIYIMGDKAEDIFLSFIISEDDRKKFQTVMDNFDNHFIVKRNIIFERAQFNRRIQREGESVNDFITDLYALADTCNYGNLHDELLRDRIVVGITDQVLSEKLQLDPQLTLQLAIDKVRLSESIKKQQSVLVNNSSINALTHKKKMYQPNQIVNKKNSCSYNVKATSQFNEKCCKWCGKSPHDRKTCPAKDSICRKCKKKGHWDRVCLSNSKRINEIHSESGFIGLMQDNQNSEEWVVPIKILGKSIKFKIDSGADHSVIPCSIAQTVLKDAQLKSTNKIIFGPDRTPLKLIGKLVENMEYHGKNSLEEIYVIKGLQTCLLGKPAIKNFGLGPNIQHCVHNITSFDAAQEFPTLFQGLGLLHGNYHIEINADAKPFALTSPRRIPIPLLEKTKIEIKRMQKLNVITPVEKPTDWCSPAVVVQKKDGNVRICVDLTVLNRSIRREWHPLPTTEYNLSLLAGAKIFSKLDANSGFWQIPLDEESSYLTTFITPFGRFRFLRLPFGISSAPEHFQRRMSQALEGLSGIICNMDDILVWGSNQKEHDERLRATLNRLKETGITLNKQKCCFSVNSIKFLGHVIDESGIRPDQEKIKAIQNFKIPTNKTELKQFLGMANYLARFVPNFTDTMAPLNSLLSSKNQYIWDTPQENAMAKLKEILSSEPILTIFDPNKQSIVSADASSYGLGATICQKQGDSTVKVIAYASRTLTPTEQRYAQIEKEALALTWACEKFCNYLVGTKFLLETDHKPLIPILTRKSLDDLTPRLQRLKMRLMRYSFDVFHTPGKHLLAADALSRSPYKQEPPNFELEEEIESYVNQITEVLPIAPQRLTQLKSEQETDFTCKMLTTYALEGWPEKNKVDSSCLPFWSLRYEISIQNGLLMRGTRIIVPKKLREEILNKIHVGHMGINKCRALARSAVYWPGISNDIEKLVRECTSCIQEARNTSEPLKPTSFPQRPWEIVAMDLFKLNTDWYLLVTDFYSRYPEVAKLDRLTSNEVILHCKSIFARHGIPDTVRSDNGPQFEVTRTAEFQQFARTYGFKHVTSSPRYPQSNGFVEAAVKIIKLRFKKSKDPYLALMAYRASPLKNGYSPAELLMGRRLQTTLPIAPSELQPKLIQKEMLEKEEENRIEIQVRDYNRRHNVHELNPINPGDRVWITDRKAVAVVQKEADTPRSYIVKEGLQTLRRNRKHLVPGSRLQLRPVEQDIEDFPKSKEVPETTRSGNAAIKKQGDRSTANPSQPVITRSGRTVKIPDRLNL